MAKPIRKRKSATFRATRETQSSAPTHPTAVIARLTPATYRHLRITAAERNESMGAFARRAIVAALGDKAP